MVLGAVPAGEAGHHRKCTSIDRGGIALSVFGSHLAYGNQRITLVLAAICAAIGKIVLGDGGDLAWP